MKKYWINTLFALLLCAGLDGQAGSVRMVGFSGIAPYLSRSSDTVYVINFWATWCGPCRRELPAFEKVHQEYAGKEVQVLLVSLDFPQTLNTSLKTFLKTNQITARVMLLNAPDSDAWIDKVDPSWTGSLPATLIYKGRERHFFERELTYEDLDQVLKDLLNRKTNSI